MKKFRNVFALVLAFVIASMSTIPAYANEADFNEASRNYYANLDIEQVDSNTREKVIAAREEIIFNESWVADGLEAYVIDGDGNIKERIPEFSSVFPAEWGTSIVEQVNDATRDSLANMLANSDFPYGNYYSCDVKLQYPSTEVNTPCFKTIKTRGSLNGVATEMTSISTVGYIPNNHTFNLGYTNISTGRSLLHKMRLKNNEGLKLNTSGMDITLGIRASSFVYGGNMSFWITEIWDKR